MNHIHVPLINSIIVEIYYLIHYFLKVNLLIIILIFPSPISTSLQFISY
jgi:hypothetical protein